MSPALSAVILTRNRPQMLQACLDSLLAQQGGAVEVFVIGNPDDAGTPELMKQYDPAVARVGLGEARPTAAPGRAGSPRPPLPSSSPLVETPRAGSCLRPGATARQAARPTAPVHYLTVENSVSILSARNRGAEQATADYVAFLDDDVTLYPGWLEACLRGLADPTVGALGGRIIDPLTEHADFKRQEPICKILPDGRYTGNQELDPGHVVEVDHLQGCNWALRKEAFFKVGAFDATWGYNLYEELDLALRLRKAGYKLVFVPEMAVYHHLAPSKNRLPKNFRIRCRNVKSLTRAYARSLGVRPGSITFSYLCRGDTGWRALARQPSLKLLSYVASGYCGKLAGLLRHAADQLTRTGPGGK